MSHNITQHVTTRDAGRRQFISSRPFADDRYNDGSLTARNGSTDKLVDDQTTTDEIPGALPAVDIAVCAGSTAAAIVKSMSLAIMFQRRRDRVSIVVIYMIRAVRRRFEYASPLARTRRSPAGEGPAVDGPEHCTMLTISANLSADENHRRVMPVARHYLRKHRAVIASITRKRRNFQPFGGFDSVIGRSTR